MKQILVRIGIVLFGLLAIPIIVGIVCFMAEEGFLYGFLAGLQVMFVLGILIGFIALFCWLAGNFWDL